MQSNVIPSLQSPDTAPDINDIGPHRIAHIEAFPVCHQEIGSEITKHFPEMRECLFHRDILILLRFQLVQ